MGHFPVYNDAKEKQKKLKIMTKLGKNFLRQSVISSKYILTVYIAEMGKTVIF